jgi:2-keto-3-deoxy-L-rhamnonate aldolase RhmA
MVRVPEIAKAWISRVLDAGADGVMVPYVETVDEVKRIIEWSKYPPMGRRGLGTQIGHVDYLAGGEAAVVEQKNRETIIVLQIETPLGVKNIAALTAVPGVDYALIGPNDLAVSMGLPGQVQSEAVFEQISKVIVHCKSKSIPCGIHVGNLKLIERCVAAGMRLIACNTDIGLLAAASKQTADQLRAMTK